MSMAQRLISFFWSLDMSTWSQSDWAWVMRASEPCVIDANQFQGNSHSFFRENPSCREVVLPLFFWADAGCLFYLRGGVHHGAAWRLFDAPCVARSVFMDNCARDCCDPHGRSRSLLVAASNSNSSVALIKPRPWDTPPRRASGKGGPGAIARGIWPQFLLVFKILKAI
jgi:hypothetical protein